MYLFIRSNRFILLINLLVTQFELKIFFNQAITMSSFDSQKLWIRSCIFEQKCHNVPHKTYLFALWVLLKALRCLSPPLLEGMLRGSTPYITMSPRMSSSLPPVGKRGEEEEEDGQTNWLFNAGNNQIIDKYCVVVQITKFRVWDSSCIFTIFSYCEMDCFLK